MKTQTIELKEFEASAPLSLLAGEVQALRALIRDASISPAGERLEKFSINPGGVIGVGEVGDRAVVIRSKFELAHLMFLLSYSMSPTRWQDLLPAFRQAENLQESIVPGFIQCVVAATSKGLLRGYLPREEALGTVRGRIDFNQLITKRHGVLPPIDCRFDEYSEDIEENRLLLAATERLLSLRRLGSRPKGQLRQIHSLFGGVSRRRYLPAAVPEISYSRLTEHYRPAVELARLILRNFAIETGRGAFSATGFFLDTARLFEDFVVIALREALGLTSREFPQGAQGRRLYLDQGRRVKLEPDLSWWRGERCLFVGDAKYKLTPQASGVKNPDLYQLLAYAQTTGVKSGMLIYAAGEAPQAQYEILRSDKVLEVWTLDLQAPPNDLLARIAQIARRIEAISGKRSAHPLKAAA